MPDKLRPFHLAIPVNNIVDTRCFYVDILGCKVGREAERWIDFSFFGHQLSAHVGPDEIRQVQTNIVDGEQIPVRHFGIIMAWADWQAFIERLNRIGVNYLIKPTVRFNNQAGEQYTLFITDPSGNALEFKSFRNDASLFATD